MDCGLWGGVGIHDLDDDDAYIRNAILYKRGEGGPSGAMIDMPMRLPFWI